MAEFSYVCVPCGVPYLTEKQKEQSGVSTFHLGRCGLCGEEKGVTHIRNYNWLRKDDARRKN